MPLKAEIFNTSGARWIVRRDDRGWIREIEEAGKFSARLRQRLAGKPRHAGRKWLRPLAAGILLVLGATIVRIALDFVPHIGPMPFITYFPAVLAASALAGLRGGLIAFAGSTAVAWWGFMPPRLSFALPEFASVVTLASFGASMAVALACSMFLQRNPARSAPERM